MKRNVLYIPLALFLMLAALLMWQLVRNADGDDPMRLESALIGKPVPVFRLESLDIPGKIYNQAALTDGKPLLLNVWRPGAPPVALSMLFSTAFRRRVFAWSV
jgi:cytochrome c biogenesis protein CcmG/thiol:disulfide interchange protein DsbE